MDDQGTATRRTLPEEIRRASLATRTVAVTLRAAFAQVRDTTILSDADRRARVAQLLAWVEPVSAARSAELAALTERADGVLTDGATPADVRGDLESALVEGRRRQDELSSIVEAIVDLRQSLSGERAT